MTSTNAAKRIWIECWYFTRGEKMLTYNLNERGTLTLYEYLYKCIKDDIVSGKIKTDEKLPSKRNMAKIMI